MRLDFRETVGDWGGGVTVVVWVTGGVGVSGDGRSSSSETFILEHFLIVGNCDTSLYECWFIYNHIYFICKFSSFL